ncbi:MULTISPECIES: hypothetical protein [unclassified Nocardioides]|uniref:hypothetical protein n=1 Tax=unclassified Nocardioides TaxID=2615069 RepID=UPI0030157730
MRSLRVLGALTVLLLTTSVLSAGAAPGRSPGPRPGPAGPSLVLDRDAAYFRFDAATDARGTTYVGWLSSRSGDEPGAEVHLCVLPVGNTRCAGGVQTIDALERLSAEQLFVVASGDRATLVWHHRNGPDATGDPMQDRIATAQVVGGVLRPAVDVAQVRSETTLLAVAAGPRGIGAVLVSGPDDDARTLYHYDTLAAAPSTVRAPYPVGNVEMVDDGRSTVMLIGEYAADADPVRVAWKPSGSGSWGAFRAVAGTETDHGTARLAATRRGIRLLATARDRKKGGDRSVVASWDPSRHAFRRPVAGLPGQSCATGGRDLHTDASGRFASVAIGCDRLAVGNHQTAGVGALKEFPVGLTTTDVDARIATAPSGRGWVVWVATDRSSLVARPIRLPALTRTVTSRVPFGRVRLTVPVSCLPAVSAPAGVKVRAARGWRVKRTSLRLGRVKVGRAINGAALRPGRKYVLKVDVRVARGQARRAWSTRVRFTTCGRP